MPAWVVRNLIDGFGLEAVECALDGTDRAGEEARDSLSDIFCFWVSKRQSEISV